MLTGLAKPYLDVIQKEVVQTIKSQHFSALGLSSSMLYSLSH